jgi:hypothetical protein
MYKVTRGVVIFYSAGVVTHGGRIGSRFPTTNSWWEKKMSPLCRSTAGWPDWETFRQLGDCLQWVVVLKIIEVAQIFARLFSEANVIIIYYFLPKKRAGLHFLATFFGRLGRHFLLGDIFWHFRHWATLGDIFGLHFWATLHKRVWSHCSTVNPFGRDERGDKFSVQITR